MTQPSTIVNEHILHDHVTGTGGLPGTINGNAARKVAETARALLGDSISLSHMMNGSDMDVFQGAPHATTGIPYAINGSATLISQKMLFWLAEFQDPIKAALGTSVVKTQRIIITKTSLVGGDATVIPERAAGKTISRKEEQRSIQLTRHGNDFLMNLNLFLRPEEAREHLNDYVTGQRLHLERALVSMGYEAMYREGTRIGFALSRASALMSIRSAKDRAIAADRLYVEGIFGAFSKNRFAIENVMTLVGKANLYTHAGATRKPMKLMIVPAGFFEFDRTKPDTMYHYITGLDRKSTHPIKVPINTGVWTDPATGITIMPHVPVAGFRQDGTANPQVETDEMQSTASIAMYYIQKTPDGGADNTPDNMRCKVVDFDARDWADLPVIPDAANRYLWYLRPQMTLLMDNAILVTDPGPETGELCIAYPSTGLSTSQTTETLRGKLRVYMNAYLKRPENVLILDNVKCSGIVGGAGSKTNIYTSRVPYDEEAHDLLAFSTTMAPHDPRIWTDDPYFKDQCDAYGIFDGYFGGANPNRKGMDTKYDTPVIFYRGTTRNQADQGIRARNNGHLGILDHVANSTFPLISGFNCV
jgi:hypothetical protein